jgi:four helix bundle protein
MGVRSYKELDIWQKSIEIVNTIYEITKKFPKEEMFGLSVQMRRSAVSISSNIAEGFSRYNNKEFRQFLYVALGSCAEVETQLIICLNQQYVQKAKFEEALEMIDHESRMIMNMIKHVSNSWPMHKRYTNN